MRKWLRAAEAAAAREVASRRAGSLRVTAWRSVEHACSSVGDLEGALAAARRRGGHGAGHLAWLGRYDEVARLFDSTRKPAERATIALQAARALLGMSY